MYIISLFSLFLFLRFRINIIISRYMHCTIYNIILYKIDFIDSPYFCINTSIQIGSTNLTNTCTCEFKIKKIKNKQWRENQKNASSEFKMRENQCIKIILTWNFHQNNQVNHNVHAEFRFVNESHKKGIKIA